MGEASLEAHIVDGLNAMPPPASACDRFSKTARWISTDGSISHEPTVDGRGQRNHRVEAVMKDLQDKVDDFLENRQPRSLGGQSTSGRHMKDTE
ncbi:hypothetical protein VCV18_009260 [Metarhizium anisopliae]